MATMFPQIALDASAAATEFTTPGEERLYRFLQKKLRPDSEFIVWYSPNVQGLEPDFVIYSPDSGLLAVEVKDWRVENIIEATTKEVHYMAGSQERHVKNPHAQARDYVNAIMRKLGKCPHLSSSTMAGKAALPVRPCVVMMNMTREAFCAAELDTVCDVEFMLFADDVHPQSPFSQDASGQALRRHLLDSFPPLFPFKLSAKQMQHLRAALFPIVRIEVPRRGMELLIAQEHLAILDAAQEDLARQFTHGKRLLRGASGSGKTLILTHKAANLHHTQPKMRRILVTCYNLTLANYMRRLLASKRITYGADAVEVIPFFELCRRILGDAVGQHIPHSGEESDFYSMVIEEAKNVLLSEGARQENEALTKSPLGCGHYDAILVDEGQDFTAPMIDVILPLLNAEHGILSVALDEQQALYTKQSVWLDKLPQMQEHILRYQYRNSVQISTFVAEELGLAHKKEHFHGAHGAVPRKQHFTDMDALCEYMAQTIANMVREGHPMSEIAVLYAKSRWGKGISQDVNIPVTVRDALERRGIMVSWVTEDDRAKRRYDITTDSVTLSTIHSVKGMDYAHVFLVALPEYSAGRNSYAERLAYVGMTRARLGLDVLFLT